MYPSHIFEDLQAYRLDYHAKNARDLFSVGRCLLYEEFLRLRFGRLGGGGGGFEKVVSFLWEGERGFIQC